MPAIGKKAMRASLKRSEVLSYNEQLALARRRVERAKTSLEHVRHDEAPGPRSLVSSYQRELHNSERDLAELVARN
jgi:hypothetical protein